MAAPSARLRVTVVGVVVISLFAALFTRLWYLQVLDHPGFDELAQRNKVRFVCEPAPRGRILDRNGTPLVDNKVSTAITLSQKAATDHPGTVPMLSALLGVPAEELLKRLHDPRYTQLKPVPIAVDVPDDKVIFIIENSDRFEGVDAAPLAQRRYPQGRVAAHLLGYTGPITQRELDARKTKPARLDGVVDPLADCDAYKLTDEIGKQGVEATFDEVLRGKPGVRQYEVDSKGKILSDTPIRVPVQGSDLVLTIDANVQREAEDSLRQGLAASRFWKQSKTDPRFLHAPGGSAVVVDVKTGGVIAMASAPDFALDDFVGGVSKDVYGAYSDDPAKPLLNRPIQGLYPPASTFKLPVAVSGLRTGIIESAGKLFLDTGEYKIPPPCSGRCKYSNSGGIAHGRIDLPGALTVSSDVYFYDVGARFWFNRSTHGETVVQDTARAFGLGSKTGIALPDEHEGRVGDPKVRKRLSKGADSGWFVGDNVNMAIGQGETLVTPLQLAMEYATFANGGTLYQPRVVEQRKEPDGTVAQDFGPIERGTVAVPPEHRGPILSGLRGVVANPAGTASNAFSGYSGMAVAGKTGTAQQPPKQDTAMFAGFAPYTAPQYAVSVVLEEAGFGGTTAAPVARRIFEALSQVPLTDVHAADSVD